ncbi:MAG: ABC-2 family transporter protein [Acidimicrobiales bacterium]|nr:ABC-2 family transporter protein [Acidimicrobiales bacterium]
MAELADAWRTYWILGGARVRSDMQYRASFALFTLSQFTITLLDFVAIVIVFTNIPRLEGWTLGEVAFLYGLGNFAFGIADLFIGSIEYLQVEIRMGTLDRILLRPASPLVQIVADRFSLRRLGKVAEGALVFAIGCGAANIDWSIERVAMTALSVLTAATIFGGVWVLTSCVCYWWVEAREAQNAFTYGGGFLAQYPLGIYGSWLRRIFAYVIPIAFANYFPAVYILERDDRLGFPTWAPFASPLVAVIVVVVASSVWRVGIRHYRSTGS